MRTAAAQVCDYASVNGPSSPNNRRERRTLIARRQRRRFRWTKVWLILAGVIALLGIVGQIFAVASPQPVPLGGPCSLFVRGVTRWSEKRKAYITAPPAA